MMTAAAAFNRAEKEIAKRQQATEDLDFSIRHQVLESNFPPFDDSIGVMFCHKKPMVEYDNVVYLPVKAKGLFKAKRFKVFEGGRGSAKSRSAATAAVLRCVEKKTRVLCTRELQHSIQESIHRLISDTIDRLGLTKHFTVTNTHIRCKNGSEFIFSGIKNNVNKIKSMEDIDICLCEESEAITEGSWRVLTPTIRASGSEIWVIFNAYDVMDATYTRFITHCLAELNLDRSFEDDLHIVERMNYPDNPWFPYELQLEMEKMKEEHYRDYLHVWMGEPVGASENAIIDPLWVRAAVDAHLKLGFKPAGVRSLGFDPADTGNDSKAYAVRHGSVVTHCRAWFDGDITDAIDYVFEAARDLRATDLVFDQVGVGAAVKHHIRQLEGRDAFTTTGFLGNDTPEQPESKYMGDRSMADTFRNRRAQAFWLLRDRFEKTYRAVEKGEYTDPDELISLSSDMEGVDQLISELSRIERKRGAANNNKIQIESKDDMKKRKLKSPGLADSLMYAFSNPPPRPGWRKPIDYKDKGYA
ncbi:MAG: PBSX family phage terminase large subunit [Chloroflexi bacterium]|nr:PBSX family phage terminase large subunit [Chloroflexota bacterium]